MDLSRSSAAYTAISSSEVTSLTAIHLHVDLTTQYGNHTLCSTIGTGHHQIHSSARNSCTRTACHMPHATLHSNFSVLSRCK